ncbi:hypothetical protein Bbelb_297210 [Branchiostoma belcheri]|nr:hypothetical protein Bbelb_297210 [Branchiostoma belcheri]
MFYPVGDPASLGAELQDPKNTGSELYDSQGIENVPLSLNFEVSEFKSPTNRYFRAHPAVMDCLQRTYNVMRRDDETVEIAEGYRTSADSPSDVYLQSGAAAVIQLNQEEGGTKTMQDLAAVVIEICVPIFQEVYGDIGLILYSDKLHVRLQGADDSGPHFSADSGASMDTAAFTAWAEGQIDEAYEPIATPECEIDEDEEEVPTLASGGSWPAGETVESACGTIDYPVTRDKVEDFKRLVQYPANNIVFENEERSEAWCGSAERGRCVDCSTGIVGSGLDDRCADRVMTKSMLDLLRKVQKMVKDEFTGVKLKVLEAWDEPHAGATEGDAPAESLHFEGRAAKLTLTDGDTSKLPQLAKNAICAGANFVEHKGDHVFVAVRKQLGFTPTFVDFPENTLISVRAPADLEMNYTLPDQDLSNNNNATMPMLLFDSDGKWGMNVGANVTVDDFKDPDARYFRLNPVLVECYEALALRENKWKKHDEVYRNIKILEGYLTTEHQDDRFNLSDPRYDRHNLGWAMRVGYYGDQVDDPEVYTPLRLAKFAVIKCGPLFADNRKSIGVGMYNRSVFVDIRDDAKFWVDEPDVLPVNVTAWDWADEMAMLLEYAIEGRIIEPDSLERACLFSDPTKPQSVDFQHKHSEAVQLASPGPYNRTRQPGTRLPVLGPHQAPVQGRIIEPDSLERACLFSDPTKPQSVDFQHRHSEAGRIIEPDSLERACLFSDPTKPQSVDFQHRHSEAGRIIEPDSLERACLFSDPTKPQSVDFQHRHSEAGRIIEPDSLERACLFSDPTKPQSVDFQHKHSEAGRIIEPDSLERACLFSDPTKPQSVDFQHKHSEAGRIIEPDSLERACLFSDPTKPESVDFQHKHSEAGRIIEPDSLERACLFSDPTKPQSVDFQHRHSEAGRIIEPDSLERACLFSDPTKPQSVDFQHKHSEAVQRRRRRRRQEPAGEEECIPTSDTEFCAETAPHRETEIAHIWQAVKKKHLYRAEADVKAALEGCFGACGTCLEGEIWEEKTLHCNNFLHWVNFDFLNSEPDITNFWARDNTDLKVHACRGHCIVKAPIFSLLAPSTEELYRPDPTKSPQEQIYSMANNPLPVMDLMQAIYGMHANGRVEFYVEDEAEMQSLRASLKSVLVFNKNVTESVLVFNKNVTEVIVNAVNFEDVEAIVQNLVFEWTKSSCPDDTREFITPFSVVAMPAGVSKRSPEHEVREMMLERHRNWEHDWISRSFGKARNSISQPFVRERLVRREVGHLSLKDERRSANIPPARRPEYTNGLSELTSTSDCRGTFGVLFPDIISLYQAPVKSLSPGNSPHISTHRRCQGSGPPTQHDLTSVYGQMYGSEGTSRCFGGDTSGGDYRDRELCRCPARRDHLYKYRYSGTMTRLHPARTARDNRRHRLCVRSTSQLGRVTSAMSGALTGSKHASPAIKTTPAVSLRLTKMGMQARWEPSRAGTDTGGMTPPRRKRSERSRETYKRTLPPNICLETSRFTGYREFKRLCMDDWQRRTAGVLVFGDEGGSVGQIYEKASRHVPALGVLRMALWCTRRGLSAVLAVCCLLYVTAMFSLSGSRHHVRTVVANSAVNSGNKLRRVHRAFLQPPPDAQTTLQARTTVAQIERKALLVLSQLRRDTEVVGTLFSQQENFFFVPEHLWSFMNPDPFFFNSLPDTKMALFSENESFLNETERSRKWEALTVTLRALFRCDFDKIFNQRDRESGDEFGGGVPLSVAKDMFCREIQKSATLREGFSCHGSPDEIVRRMTSLCVAKATVAVMMTGITHVRNLQALVEDESLKLKVIEVVHDPHVVLTVTPLGLGLESPAAVIEVVHDPRAVLVSWMSAVPRRRAGDADRRGFFDTRGGLTLTATEMSRMCVAMVTNLQYWAGMRSSDRPSRANYSVLRYEDLRADPGSVAVNILSFLGQNPATSEAALHRTVARIERKIEDLKDGNGDWRRNLTVAGATKIQGRCSEAIRKFGYKFVKTERDLTDNSTSLVGTLPPEVPGVVRNSSSLVFSSTLPRNETLLLIQKPKVRTVVHYRLRVRKNETQ